MEFNINDRVVEIATGESGFIVDKLFSTIGKAYFYEVEFDDSARDDLLTADEIELYHAPKEYRVETRIADNVVIGIIYEIEGDLKTEVCRGHGHIIHEGAEGVAQACAYAYKQAFTAIDSGIYLKQKRKESK